MFRLRSEPLLRACRKPSRVIVADNNHAAIYIGIGMVMNAVNPGMGTQITGSNVFYGGYSIRRVL